MFEIIPTSDVIQIKNVKILIYGDPGAGKTSLANTAHVPLTLDFDNGAHRSSYRKDVVRITTWNDIAGNLSKFHEAVKKYNTIVIDTVDTALDYLGAWIISKDEKLARNKLQWYGKLKDEYKMFLDSLTTIGLDVIQIAHVKEKDEGDLRIKRPAITGGTYDRVMQVSDYVGIMQYHNSKRTLDFNGTEFHHGKNSAGFPRIEIPDYSEDPTFMAKLIYDMKEALTTQSETQRAAVALVAQIDSEILNINSAIELNMYMEGLGELPKNLKLQTFNKLKKRAAYIGAEYNAEIKEFVNTLSPEPDANGKEQTAIFNME